MTKRNNPKQLRLEAEKPVRQMPDGYYSGDKPNSKLRAFVKRHSKERPYDPKTDEYDIPAFNEPIKTTKASAIYSMHTFWSKKPHDAIRQYIRHYTRPGDLVLDPLCGSGGTALAALMEGRKAIAIDRSPAATFITKNYCTPVEVNALRGTFDKLKKKLQSEIEWLYETRCDRCGGNATTVYTVYSQTFQCSRCLEKVTLFECIEVQGETATGKPKTIMACPHCHERGLVEEISPRSERFGAVPVLTSYVCNDGCKPARSERQAKDEKTTKREYFTNCDLKRIHEIEAKRIPYWVPPERMMNSEPETERWALLWRPYLGDRALVTDFFRPRNLWALALILKGIREVAPSEIIRDALLFVFSSCVLNASDMYRYRKSGKGGISMGTFYVGPVYQVMNAWRCFEDKYRSIERAFPEIRIKSGGFITSTESATDLSSIPSNSVDYIFTDPPYSWKVQYGESNFIWEAWLGFDTKWHHEEIIVNEVRGKTQIDWSVMMRQAMAECYRVLKPGRWISLCYHDTSEGTWGVVQDIMAEVGFVVDRTGSTLFIDTNQKSWKQLVADKVTKRDLVINFRKPKPGELASAITISGKENERTFREKVLTIIQDFLLVYPGSTKDRIYDQVVSRLVRKGRMEAFDFEEVLGEIAESISEPIKKNLFKLEDPNLFGTHEIKRWYLKDAVDKVDDEEVVREDAAAAKLETFMTKYLKKHPEREGVHYSDLFEQIVVMDRPRREMADWLIDYFYKTEEGTWRPPMTDEEKEEKAKQRATGALRKIKSFARLLESGAPVPERLQPQSDGEIADWVHQARRAGLYHQGKVIFEKSGLNLSRLEEVDENLAMDLNEDYQYCLKQLGEG